MYMSQLWIINYSLVCPQKSHRPRYGIPRHPDIFEGGFLVTLSVVRMGGGKDWRCNVQLWDSGTLNIHKNWKKLPWVVEPQTLTQNGYRFFSKRIKQKQLSKIRFNCRINRITNNYIETPSGQYLIYIFYTHNYITYHILSSHIYDFENGLGKVNFDLNLRDPKWRGLQKTYVKTSSAKAPPTRKFTTCMQWLRFETWFKTNVHEFSYVFLM